MPELNEDLIQQYLTRTLIERLSTKSLVPVAAMLGLAWQYRHMTPTPPWCMAEHGWLVMTAISVFNDPFRRGS